MSDDGVELPSWARYASNVAAGVLFGLGVTLACLAWVDMFGYAHFFASMMNL